MSHFSLGYQGQTWKMCIHERWPSHGRGSRESPTLRRVKQKFCPGSPDTIHFGAKPHFLVAHKTYTKPSTFVKYGSNQWAPQILSQIQSLQTTYDKHKKSKYFKFIYPLVKCLIRICVNRNCIHIFKICESIYATHETFQLFKICDPHIFSRFGRFDPICWGHIF